MPPLDFRKAWAACVLKHYDIYNKQHGQSLRSEKQLMQYKRYGQNMNLRKTFFNEFCCCTLTLITTRIINIALTVDFITVAVQLSVLVHKTGPYAYVTSAHLSS